MNQTALVLDPMMIQILIYGGIAAGGYLISHLGIFSRLFGGGTPAPVPAPTPAPASPFGPLLQAMLPVLEEQVMEMMKGFAANLLQPPQPPVK